MTAAYKPRSGSNCDLALKFIRSNNGRASEAELATLLNLAPVGVAPSLRYGMAIQVVVRHGEGRACWYTEGEAALREKKAKANERAVAALTGFFALAGQTP